MAKSLNAGKHLLSLATQTDHDREMDQHSKPPRYGPEEVPWPGKTLNSLPNDQASCFWCQLLACLMPWPPLCPRRSGTSTLNLRSTLASALDTGVGSGILDRLRWLRLPDTGAHVQAGPDSDLPATPDTGDLEIEFTGKAGISGGPLYGRASFIRHRRRRKATGNVKTGVASSLICC